MLVLMNVKEVGEFSVVISVHAQLVKPKSNLSITIFNTKNKSHLHFLYSGMLDFDVLTLENILLALTREIGDSSCFLY